MVSVRSLVFVAAATAVYAQEMTSLQPCAVDCYNRSLAEFSRFGCASATDIRCMCLKPDWGFSIRDCASAACEPGYVNTVTAAASALCATATVAPPTASQTTTPATTAPTSTPTTTPATTSSSTSTTTAASTAAKLTSSTTSSATSSSTRNASTSNASATRAPAATTSAAAPVSSNQGMTTATKIGLGVGLTVAVAALIGAIIFFLLRRRQNKRVPAGPKHWKISEPMPTHSGRAYSQENHSYETGLSELEMKSRRYEDMVPRQKPRHMV